MDYYLNLNTTERCGMTLYLGATVEDVEDLG